MSLHHLFSSPSGWFILMLICLVDMEKVGASESEYEKKADYLVMISDYVDWPRSGSLIFCIIKPNPFGAGLNNALAKKRRLDGKRLKVRYITAASNKDSCNILFLSDKLEKGIISDIIDKVRHSALTVSDATGFAKQGGMINFIGEGARIRFEINQTAARNANLKISSQLLKLARKLY